MTETTAASAWSSRHVHVGSIGWRSRSSDSLPVCWTRKTLLSCVSVGSLLWCVIQNAFLQSCKEIYHLQCISQNIWQLFPKFTWNSRSVLWTSPFHSVVVNQNANFRTKFWISLRTLLRICMLWCNRSLRQRSIRLIIYPFTQQEKAVGSIETTGS